MHYGTVRCAAIASMVQAMQTQCSVLSNLLTEPIAEVQSILQWVLPRMPRTHNAKALKAVCKTCEQADLHTGNWQDYTWIISSTSAIFLA